MSKVNKTDEKNNSHEETLRERNQETQGDESTSGHNSHEPSDSPSSLSDKVEGDDCSTEEEDEKIGWLEKLQVFLSSKLKLDEKEDVPQVLDEVNIDGIVSYIKGGKCKNIITMTGAGISTSAGIPDFRSPDSGLYSNLSKYNLPHPEAIFDIEFFKENPQPFFALAKELYPGTFNPTPSHYFIRLLNDKGLLLRHYTQNIDTLEHIAGIPADKLVEAHGTFRTAHCLSCNKAYEQEWMKEEIFADRVPSCEVCCGVVKPDIVFFRESLPSRFFKFMTSDFKQCDLLIIMGTSLTVQPFASLVNDVSASCPRLLINREKVGWSDPMMAAFQGVFGRGGLDFDSANNKRDVTLIGDCDQGCSTLAEKLGWKEDLEDLVSQKVQA